MSSLRHMCIWNFGFILGHKSSSSNRIERSRQSLRTFVEIVQAVAKFQSYYVTTVSLMLSKRLKNRESSPTCGQIYATKFTESGRRRSYFVEKIDNCFSGTCYTLDLERCKMYEYPRSGNSLKTICTWNIGFHTK